VSPINTDLEPVTLFMLELEARTGQTDELTDGRAASLNVPLTGEEQQQHKR